ncbi:MAG: hypothetical protein ABH808_01910 [Candidatus Kuenenbacteria bacterium]
MNNVFLSCYSFDGHRRNPGSSGINVILDCFARHCEEQSDAAIAMTEKRLLILLFLFF